MTTCLLQPSIDEPILTSQGIPLINSYVNPTDMAIRESLLESNKPLGLVLYLKSQSKCSLPLITIELPNTDIENWWYYDTNLSSLTSLYHYLKSH
jgi:hypothetical protein